MFVLPPLIEVVRQFFFSYIENILCIRTLIKLSYHTSSVEAVHSQVIFLL